MGHTIASLSRRARALGAAPLCALLVIGAGCNAAGEPAALRAVAVRGALDFRGTYYGEFAAAEKIDIHAPDLEETNQLTVESVLADGATVEEGEVVLTFARETIEMDLRDESEKLAVARATREKVAQQLDKERIDLDLDRKRKKLALERAELQVVEGTSLISQLELDKAKLDVEKARLELALAERALASFAQKRRAALKVEDLAVEAAERAVEARERGLELIEVRAPRAGVVYAPYTRLNWQRTKAAPGVVARPGDKILEMPDLSRYVVEVYARQSDAALISVGDAARVTPLILPGVELGGRVVEKGAFATTRNERFGTETAAGNLKEYLIRLEVDGVPEAIRPGNSARVVIETVLADDAVLLPLPFVAKDEGGSWSVLLDDGSARAVTLGRASDSHVAIVSGLKPGERVRLPEGSGAASGSEASERD